MRKYLTKKSGDEFTNYFIKRLKELRLRKKVSAREMSISIGQSAGYINRIENRQMLPSFPIFISICEYLDIKPSDFLYFYKEDENNRFNRLLNKIQALPNDTIEHIELLVDDLSINKS